MELKIACKVTDYGQDVCARTQEVKAGLLGGQNDVVHPGRQGAQEKVRVRDGRAEDDAAAGQQLLVLGRPGAGLEVQQVTVLAPLL